MSIESAKYVNLSPNGGKNKGTSLKIRLKKFTPFLWGILIGSIFTIFLVFDCDNEDCFITSTSSKSHSRGIHLNNNRLYNNDYDDGNHVDLNNEVKILCWIMTSPENHKLRAIHVNRTWGRRCNKLLFMSSSEDDELNTIALNVDEGRSSLWNKTREAFKFVYENFLNDYDWFLKADDDTYVIVENLRYLLYAYDPEYPIYFGSKFKYDYYVENGYMSGGSGYVLSREALRRFYEISLNDTENCYEYANVEDLEMGRCLQNVNVTAGDSRDMFGKKKFLPLDPGDHLFSRYSHDFWYYKMSYYTPFEGMNCCSDYAISFHYIHPRNMYIMEYLIYHLKPFGVKHNSIELPKKKTLQEALMVAIADPYAWASEFNETDSSTSPTIELQYSNESNISANYDNDTDFVIELDDTTIEPT